MNAKTPLKEAILRSSRKLGIILLIFQMNSCDLEVIPPTNGATRSSFQFIIQDPACTSDCTVTFNNTSENADTYEWNFGDESALSTLSNPSHTYAGPGSYDVTLRAFRDTVEHDTTITVLINTSPSTLQAFTHTASAANTSSQLTTLDNVLTNARPNKIIIVTSVLGLRNSAALGVYYFENKWKIFTQNSANIQANEIFNIVAADPGSNAFVHTTSAANLRAGHISTIDHASANNHPEARVFVTPVWEKSTDYNNHPLGVVYINNHWEIVNLDQANIPVGLKFNVIVSTDTKSFIHTTSVSSITGDYSVLDHAGTNSKPGAKIVTTLNQGTNDAPLANPRQTGLWYRASSGGRWTVFNQNGDVMPQNVSFNILAIE